VSGHSAAGENPVEARLELEVGLDRNEPRRVVEQFEQFALEHELPMGLTFKFQLALDELLTNVVSYAFEEGVRDPVITLVLQLADGRLEAVLRDNGRPFNPLRDAPVPDLDLSAEDRRVGGLGIHLTKAFVHTLSYERVDGWNRLNLVQPLVAHQEDQT
jgi:anti-sigma regulatory factor (Ser/Thr protein kinase)